MNIDFFKCKNHIKYDDLLDNYLLCQENLSITLSSVENLKRELLECDFKIFRQRKEIARLHKQIKELKNEKNS